MNWPSFTDCQDFRKRTFNKNSLFRIYDVYPRPVDSNNDVISREDGAREAMRLVEPREKQGPTVFSENNDIFLYSWWIKRCFGIVSLHDGKNN